MILDNKCPYCGTFANEPTEAPIGCNKKVHYFRCSCGYKRVAEEDTLNKLSNETRIFVKLSRETIYKLTAISKETNKNRNDIIEEALTNYFEKYDEGNINGCNE